MERDMLVLTGKTVYFDVDRTLVFLEYPASVADKTIEVTTQHRDKPAVTRRVLPHWVHVEEIKQYKFRGQNVVIWSAGGSTWAKAVVESLKLEDYVDCVIPKPDWIYDDIPSSVFMPPPIYKHIKGVTEGLVGGKNPMNKLEVQE